MNFQKKEGKKLKYLISVPEKAQKLKNLKIIFFMHGYGDSMNGISQICNFLNPNNVYVFLNAPFKMNISFDFEGYRWFEFPLDYEEFKFSQEAINYSIDEIISELNLNFHEIFIGGFSQGGMMTLHNNYKGRLDGLIILGSRLVHRDSEFNLNKNNRIFMSHGVNDVVIPIEEAKSTVKFLKEKINDVFYKEFPIGHELSPDQLSELNKWINRD